MVNGFGDVAELCSDISLTEGQPQIEECVRHLPQHEGVVAEQISDTLGTKGFACLGKEGEEMIFFT